MIYFALTNATLFINYARVIIVDIRKLCAGIVFIKDTKKGTIVFCSERTFFLSKLFFSEVMSVQMHRQLKLASM